MPIHLAQRHLEPEWMDQPGLEPALHTAALHGLARLNWFSRSAQIVWNPIRRLSQEVSRPLTVLDLACGAGDVPIALWQRARRAGIDLRITGCDISPTAVAHARERAERSGAAIDFRQADAFAVAIDGPIDVVMCSLFLHHLPDEAAVELLRRMGRVALHLVLVNDLERSRMGYALAWAATRLLTRSPVVHVDGPRSVAAAFTRREALQLASQAGMHGATVHKCWPHRWLLSWRRPTDDAF